jgi:hypothetical protein
LGILVGCDRFFLNLLPCDRVSVLAGVGGDRFFPNLLPCDRVSVLAGVGGDRFFLNLLPCDRSYVTELQQTASEGSRKSAQLKELARIA